MKHVSLYNATYTYYLAKKREAEAMLEMVFNDSVMVGGHTTLLEEAKKWTQELANTEDCIRILSDYYDAEYLEEVSDVVEEEEEEIYYEAEEEDEE